MVALSMFRRVKSRRYINSGQSFEIATSQMKKLRVGPFASKGADKQKITHGLTKQPKAYKVHF
jgi:hypothetical protein